VTQTAPDGVDLARLERFFTEHVEGASGPLSAELISGGRSNLTYAVSDRDHVWVLRRPPLGHVLPTAHDMAREFRVIRALAGSSVPVPRALAFCDDVAVNDAPFYVMERVDGRILRTQADLEGISRDEARRCSDALVDVLAALHSIDADAVGLGDFGRPDGFVERNVRRWGKQWEASRDAGCPDSPAIDELARRLTAELPPSPRGTIVHGDYRLDNTMVANDDAGRVVAVLDWEMSTLGDPLTDLGLFLLYYGRGDAQVVATGGVISPALGFATREEVIDRYARATGIDLSWLDWYEVFASYKLAIIVAGIHARYLMGQTRGDGFDHMGAMVSALADGAVELASRSSIATLRG